MGELYDYLSGRDKQADGEELIRRKIPATPGLSAETAARVAAGELRIESSNPAADKLRELIDSDDNP